MFGFLISRCRSSLGMIAILAKLLTLVACEDLYNSDGGFAVVNDFSSKYGKKLVFISNEEVNITDEVLSSLNKNDRVPFVLLENTRPKTTGWKKIASITKDDINEGSHFDQDLMCINKRYYCTKLCLPRNKIYHSVVSMCDNNVLKPVPITDSKDVSQRSRGGNGDGVPIIYRNVGGEKKKSSKTLYIILGAIAILGILLLFAICLSKR